MTASAHQELHALDGKTPCDRVLRITVFDILTINSATGAGHIV